MAAHFPYALAMVLNWATFARPVRTAIRPARPPCRQVLLAAQAIDRDPERVLRWYSEDPIESLGSRTAAELVDAGHADLVIRFLEAVMVREARAMPVH
ncbi:DUF2384 domain-containing protein [Luteibacter pinisoli]|uniref:DUF2384 domain-containing protein n=1 Tax=Luteibacter pinisoli TaxID=2589080 RepID=A0A4Y5Z367_9GAMM|nr:DUF2384 domain-containing protein [Luteibacter pinisoli]QDE39830.1 DUF2384 domain-containing protein [Luteibacter pinisoli]